MLSTSAPTVAMAHPQNPSYDSITTTDALKFLSKLHEKFNNRRLLLLEDREKIQLKIDKGLLPSFLENTEQIRNGSWVVSPLPHDLIDRRVEITGPVSRKMVINALNSGAKVFMADFEDSNSPSWKNNMEGQINLKDAINREIDFTVSTTGKEYKLNSSVATLMVRPRGWHLEEHELTIEGMPISGSLLDFGLYFFHNAKSLINNGSGPYFYLPKLESHLEARLWNDVFLFAQDYMNIPSGTIKATVLVETITASFELNEILFELKEHSAGLNCGRWDYIFSYIKRFRNHPELVLPNRDQVTMEVGFMDAYSKLVIETCHKRGVHAMGGMAAQIPIKNNSVANDLALNKVRDDKLREVKNGHDGTWVAHPGLVKIAMDIFNSEMPEANQISKKLYLGITEKDLLAAPIGTITEEGVRKNINVAILYIESWLRGIGAAAIYNLMEDAATAEISRTQIWQWINHSCKLDDGREITHIYCNSLIPDELEKIKGYVGEEKFKNGRFDIATILFKDLINSKTLEEFLTINAYTYLNNK
jgi:malate synthase